MNNLVKEPDLMGDLERDVVALPLTSRSGFLFDDGVEFSLHPNNDVFGILRAKEDRSGHIAGIPEGDYLVKILGKQHKQDSWR